MSNHSGNRHSKRTHFTIILPTILTLAFLISIIYGVVIPAFEKNFLEGKKSTIHQLTSVAVDIMRHYDDMIKNDQIKTVVAKEKAQKEIESLRYGDTKQDYFWICDLQPKMVMHPYSKEMIGADLSEYEDSSGTRIFLKFIEIVTSQQSGFLYHTWHTKYHEESIAPKLTYVTTFEPWGWIIGTGVYLDDVQRKTDEIYAYLSKLALGVVVIVSFLFFYLTRQSLINERKRFQAEAALMRSREKYKSLVESATEPMMMFFDNHCIYSNSSMQQLLGGSREELDSATMLSFFPANISKSLTSKPLNESANPDGIDTTMLKMDGSQIQVRLILTEKILSDEKVQIITARDMSSRRRIEDELGVSRQRYQWLSNQLQIGIFRTSSAEGLTILEANPIVHKLLGLSKEHIGKKQLIDVFENSFDANALQVNLYKKGVIKDQMIPIRTTNGIPRMVSISMVITRDTMDTPMYCDGIIEDITLQQAREEKREDLLIEMQSSMMFLNDPVKNVIQEKTTYKTNMTVEDAVKAMYNRRSSTLFLTDKTEKIVGIFGDSEIRKMVIDRLYSSNSPVGKFMNRQIDTIPDTTPVFEAVLMMGEQQSDHLYVSDNQGTIIGIISDKELLQVHRHSATFLLKEVKESKTIEEIVSCHTRLPGIVKALTDSGVNTRNITRIMTSISDAVFNRILEFSLNDLGEPPVPFVIIGLGSDGREEQTLATDQDNALIFKDVPPEQLESAQKYFLALASLICNSLDKVGYVLCKGEIMAMNPRWCKPITIWKEYFTNWITSSTPQDLMELNIFFDYRCIYGDSDFLDELRGHLQNLLRNRPIFYHLMAENNLLFKIPLDFFGNISVDTEGEYTNCFNIKHVIAMIVGFARIHGIKHSLETSNTLERLENLYDRGALNKETHDELVDSYDYLMQMRLRHQVQKIDRGEKPDNWINVSELTHMENDMLKKIFAKVATLRKKLTGKGESNIFF
ncbi:DUF294 nucleotidyltransferase-like domain-containing protein [Desulforhopalus sp. 52FAK]